jgi:hypothetical protein
VAGFRRQAARSSPPGNNGLSVMKENLLEVRKVLICERLGDSPFPNPEVKNWLPTLNNLRNFFQYTDGEQLTFDLRRIEMQ